MISGIKYKTPESKRNNDRHKYRLSIFLRDERSFEQTLSSTIILDNADNGRETILGTIPSSL